MTLSGRLGKGGWRRCSHDDIPLAERKAGPPADPRGEANPATGGGAAQRSVTDFVLESASASASETLADRQSFQLDPEQWEVFVAALDAPPQVHPRLARLLQEPSLLEQVSAGGAG